MKRRTMILAGSGALLLIVAALVTVFLSGVADPRLHVPKLSKEIRAHLIVNATLFSTDVGEPFDYARAAGGGYGRDRYFLLVTEVAQTTHQSDGTIVITGYEDLEHKMPVLIYMGKENVSLRKGETVTFLAHYMKSIRVTGTWANGVQAYRFAPVFNCVKWGYGAAN